MLTTAKLKHCALIKKPYKHMNVQIIMKRGILLIAFLAIVIFISGCEETFLSDEIRPVGPAEPNDDPDQPIIPINIVGTDITTTIPKSILPPPDPKTFECSTDLDCILVKSAFCGGPTSINNDYKSEWDKRLQDEAEILGDVQCGVTLPLNWFNAQCTNNKCQATQVRSS